MSTIKEINNQIAIKTAELKEVKLAYEDMKKSGRASYIAMAKGDVESVEQQLAILKSELESEEQIDKLKSFDWATHESSIIRQSYATTMKEHSRVSFNTVKKVKETLKNAILSTHEDEIAVILSGITGTGKTTAVKWVGGEINRPVVSQVYSGNMEETDIIGGPTITADGKVVMKDGPLVEAMKAGVIYVAEEMNFAKPAIMAILNGLMDGNQQIIMPSGDIVNVAPGFKFIGTINPGYAGTREFNKALVSRFSTVIEFQRPTTTKLKQIVKGKTQYALTDKAEQIELERMIVMFEVFEGLIKKFDIDGAISVRQLIACARKLQSGETFKNAVKYGVINQVANFDEHATKQFTSALDKIATMNASDLAKNVAKDGE